MDLYRIRSRTVVALAGLCLGAPAFAGLGFDEATRIAIGEAPSLLAQQQALAGVQAAQPAAQTLPDPRLTLGIDNLPVNGPDRYRLTRDFMTMQRIGLMQEVPNRAKREARAQVAQARIARERANLAQQRLAVKREAALAWLAVYFAERRGAELSRLEAENRILIETLVARIAAGKAMPAEHTMARQEALALADRRDDLQRDIAKARASLRRWVGERADAPLDGEPPALALQPDQVRAALHRHAEVAPYAAMQTLARAEASEASAEQLGDWSWELVYSRRGPQFGDMVSFQVSLDLPWQRERRQQPLLAAREREVARIEAERDELLRRHAEEVDAQLAELRSLEAQRERLLASGNPLAAERVALALAGYESGRGDLAAVLAARREAVEIRLRAIDLDAQRLALRLRLTTLIAE
jgi:outer membrane protein TolC